MGIWSTPPDPTAMAAAILSDDMPATEGRLASAGAQQKGSRSDHVHERLTATQTGNLDGTAQAIVMFTRTFTTKPAMSLLPVEDNTNPVPRFKVRRFLTPAGANWTSGQLYGGCVIYADRARSLPALSGIILVGPLITALAGFLPWEAATGAEFSLIAVQAS